MAGLVAAARARQLGTRPVVLEKGTRPGGSMLLSSGVIWRHRTLEDFRAECPGGEAALQARVVEELDDALDWLESLGVEPVARETGNPLTVGRRYDPRALTDALVRAVGDGLLLEAPFAEAQVLATGGFATRLARERGLLLRANPWSEGEGLDYGVSLGGAMTAGMDEFYGRALPGPVGEEGFVRASQLYAKHALVVDDEGRDLGGAEWHESDVVQRFPEGRAWYVVDARALRERTPYGTVADAIEAARAAGDVRPVEELPFALPASPMLAETPFTAVRVYAAVTHTIGGLRIDDRARVLDADGAPVAGLHACGADAGGIFTGGYGSGLAAALVFGRLAAETALG
jgi:fumarate reductase flavoprotein subunit